MKNISKRLICLVVSVCICCTAFSQMFAFAADDTEPVLSSRCETVIDVAGKDGTFGDSTSALRTGTSIKLSSALNLSASDIFELDVYVENISALKGAINDTQYVQFGFSSNSRRATSNHAEADISSQLTKNGWNSVCVNREDFTENGINWGSIYFVFIRFADETQDLPSALVGTDVKIRNICESYSVPELNDGDVTLYNSYIISSLGENADSPISYIGETFTAKVESTDLTDVAFLKVDLLSSDLAAFRSLLANKKLRFTLSSINGIAYYDFAGAYFANTPADWYSVRLPLNDFIKDEWFDVTKVTGVKAEIAGVNSGEKIGDYYSLKFGFANIRGIKITSPEYDGAYGKETEDYGIKQTVISFGRKYADFSYNSSGEYKPLADADNIELDLYIDNYNSFKDSFVYDSLNTPVNASLDIKFSNGTGVIVWSGIEKKVISAGWNHIILPVADAINSGFDKNAAFSDITIEITGVDATLENPAYGSFIIADRLISTKGDASSNALKFEAYAVLSEGKSILTGSTYKASEITETLTTPADLTDAKFIECDIYIQNFEAFKAISTQNGINDISLMLSSAAGTATEKITGKIRNNGWNHIEVPLSAFINGTFDVAGVSSWKLLYNGNSSAETGILQNQRVAVKNITATVVNDPQMPQDPAVIISEAGKTGIYGNSYSSIETSSVITLSEPADLSETGLIEFDFYVENFERFSSIINGKPLYFAIGTNTDKSKGVGRFDFTNQVIGSGWNHITVDTMNCVPAGGSEVSLDTVYYTFLTFSSETGANAYGDEPFKYKNVVGNYAEYDILPSLPNYVDKVVMDDTLSKTIGEGIQIEHEANSGGYSARKKLDAPVDLSKSDNIEFDIYIKDKSILDAYKEGLYLSLYTREDGYGGYRADYYYFNETGKTGWNEQITTSGWNHVKVSKESARSRGAVGTYPFQLDWTNVCAVAFMTYTTQIPPAGTGKTNIIIANVCGTIGEKSMIPALPENVVAKIDEGSEATLGAYFGYTQDRIFKQCIGPYDFSKCNIIEFDIYVSDYDLLKQAFENARGAKMTLSLSSTKAELFGQYQKPRFYYAVQTQIQDKITKTGWNHIRVSKFDFEQLAAGHTMDWSNITSFMLRFPLSKLNTNPEEMNPAGDVYVKIVNIVNTGILAEIPHNDKQPSRPDKTAVYINDAEDLVDDNGSWNPSEVYLEENYKSENAHSVFRKVSYSTDPLFAYMFFLFDDSADFSDIKSLKLDLFVDLPQFIQKSGNKLEIGISSERNFMTGSYKWEINTQSLKGGWNALEFNISDANKVGTVSLGSIKTVFIRFDSLNLSADDFELIIMGVDNLRYLSKTGNTELKIISDYEEDFSSDDYDIETETEFDDSDWSDEPLSEQNVIHLKRTINKVITDYVTAIIILGCEFAVLSAASVVGYILIKKKKLK